MVEVQLINHAIAIFVGLSTSKNFTIIVKDTNDPPTGISVSGPLSIYENNLSGEYVGTVTTADQDVGQTHKYQIADVVGQGHDAQRYEAVSVCQFDSCQNFRLDCHISNSLSPQLKLIGQRRCEATSSAIMSSNRSNLGLIF